MASINTVSSGNALLMVAVVPLPMPLHTWLAGGAKTIRMSPGKGQLAATAAMPESNTTSEESASGKSTLPTGGLQGAMWQLVRRLQGTLTEEERQAARSAFGVDAQGNFCLPTPSWNWPELPWYATREGVTDALETARRGLPAFVGVTACSAAIICRQPRLGLCYAAGRLSAGLRPWLGAGVAKLAARPAAVAAVAGGLPILLAAVPAYYTYLVFSAAGRLAVELGTDAQQLVTVVQIVANRCEPVFRAADGLPVDAALRVIAVGLKQHLPDHVTSVVKQALYVGQHTGNMSARLTNILEAAVDWASGEQGRHMLDQLVRLTEVDDASFGADTPRAA